MRIRLSFLGILGDYAGCSEVDVEVKEGSTVGNLLQEVGKRFGQRFPQEVWDPEEKAFGTIVSIFLDGKDVEDGNELLREDSEVILLTMIAGGIGYFPRFS